MFHLTPSPSTAGIMTTNPTKRLVKNAAVDADLINKTLNLLKLTPIGEVTVPENGRIASNICVNTSEKGMVMLRFYPEGYHEEKLETGTVDFEIETLYFFSSHGLSVPSPLLFGPNEYKREENGIKIFAYKLLPGECFKITDLSNEIATKSGMFLRDMLAVSQKFVPKAEAPEGDLEYFLKIFKALLNQNPQLKTSAELNEMADFTQGVIQKGEIARTPKGIVHADFFFENILEKDDGTLGAIDFGDAYYGHVIMDVVIGSMEFCVLEDAKWDLEMFKCFLTPHAVWLKSHKISADLFYSLLAANCLRFAVYTMPNTLADKLEVKENPYVHRFYQLMVPEFKANIEAAYASVIQ